MCDESLMNCAGDYGVLQVNRSRFQAKTRVDSIGEKEWRKIGIPGLIEKCDWKFVDQNS